jgi:hypothetical protein
MAAVVLILLLVAVFGPQVLREVKRRRLRRDISSSAGRWAMPAGAGGLTVREAPALFFVGGSVGDGFATSAPYVMVAFDSRAFVARQINAIGRDAIVVIEHEARPQFVLDQLSANRSALRARGRPVELRGSIDRIRRELSDRGWIIDRSS